MKADVAMGGCLWRSRWQITIMSYLAGSQLAGAGQGSGLHSRLFPSHPLRSRQSNVRELFRGTEARRPRRGGTPGHRGALQWTTKTCGTVVRTERLRHGLHFQRNFDDKVFSDVILLELPDGELTTVTLDEFTTLRRA